MSDTARPNTSENLELVNIKIFLNDGSEAIDQTYQLSQISIYKQLYKINKAEIKFIDGEVATGEFPIMDSNEFVPGTPIRIELGYGTGNENEIGFDGIISQVEIQTDSEKQPMFVIKCVDKSFNMTINSQYIIYENKKDSDVFGDILDRHEGVSSGEVEATTYEYPSIVQFGKNDWDFLIKRAKNIGKVVFVEGGKVSIKKPDTQTTSIQVTFGTDIIRQKLSFSATSIVEDVEASSWNATDQELRIEHAEEIAFPLPGNEQVDFATVSGKFTTTPQIKRSHADLDTNVIKDLASGQLLQHHLHIIHGYILIPGTNEPKVDSAVEILRAGNFFSGKGYITGVEHLVIEGNWTTRLWIGLKKDPLSSVLRKQEDEGFSALQIGKVKQIHGDPAGNTRILVNIPGLVLDGEGIWARVLQRYATNEAGSMFFPEIGDEVLLGFLSHDPQSPIVLGSLYSQTKVSPFELEEENMQKAFVSREKLTLSFDEENKAISLTTPASNFILLSDEEGRLLLQDQNGNKMEFSDKGLLLESSSDISIKATGDIQLETNGNISLKATGDLSAEGMNVAIKANMKVENKANIIETKATAQLVLKGGLIQIN